VLGGDAGWKSDRLTRRRNARPIVIGTNRKWLIEVNANWIRARSTFIVGHLREKGCTVFAWSLKVMVFVRESGGIAPI